MRDAIDRPPVRDRLAIDSKTVSIVLLAGCMVMTLSLWFSVSAVIPVLKKLYALGDGQAGLMASAVSIGFVVGTMASAVLGLADRLHPRLFFMASALTGAAANALILAFEPTAPVVIALRFVTGIAMAGIYPVGVKMVATWARGDTGLLVGLLIAALCLGSATPHLFSAFTGLNWQGTLLLTSAAAAAAGLLVNLAGLGPSLRDIPPFEPKYVAHAWRDREILLTNLGYWGHKWENYAMWAWIGVFLQASFSHTVEGDAGANFYAGLVTFAVIAAGGLGCIAGGLVADRVGRTTVLMIALLTSGACSILSGLFFDGNPWLLSLVCIVWGVMVVADSPQFSASIIELSEHAHVGTMLTFQTSVGFLVTLASIHVIPVFASVVGWRYAFAALAVGPVLGCISIYRLRRHPAAVKLANGKR